MDTLHLFRKIGVVVLATSAQWSVQNEGVSLLCLWRMMFHVRVVREEVLPNELWASTAAWSEPAASHRSSPAAASSTAPAGQSPLARRTLLRLAESFRRLRVRTERRADVHQAILSVASSIISLRNTF
jgi:hypothetical protein